MQIETLEKVAVVIIFWIVLAFDGRARGAKGRFVPNCAVQAGLAQLCDCQRSALQIGHRRSAAELFEDVRHCSDHSHISAVDECDHGRFAARYALSATGNDRADGASIDRDRALGTTGTTGSIKV